MAVYVDEARHPLGRMATCHMVADTVSELHSMAASLGLSRRMFQASVKHPHYDVCKENRAKAVRAGAVEVGTRDIVRIARSIRADPEAFYGR